MRTLCTALDPCSIDAYICQQMGSRDEYSASVQDRNDYAIMVARTRLAFIGCRATRDRVMPIVQEAI